MHLVEQRLIRLPGALGHFLRPLKPVRTFDWKRPARLSCQAPPCGIFPVRGMDDELPDIMPSPRGPPRGLRRRDATNRAAESRAVPRGMVVSLIENGQQEPDVWRRGHLSRHSCGSGSEMSVRHTTFHPPAVRENTIMSNPFSRYVTPSSS